MAEIQGINKQFRDNLFVDIKSKPTELKEYITKSVKY